MTRFADVEIRDGSAVLDGNPLRIWDGCDLHELDEVVAIISTLTAVLELVTREA